MGHQVTLVYLGKSWMAYDDRKTDLDGVRYFRLTEDDRSKLVLVPDLRSSFLLKDFVGVTRQVAMSFPHFLDHYDVIHVEFLFTANLVISAMALKFLQDAPHVIDFVDLTRQLTGGHFRKSHRLYNLLYTIRYLPTWSTVCSDYLRSYLIKRGYPERMIYTVPMGADVTKIRYVDKGDSRRKLKLSEARYLMGYELGTGRQDTYIDTILLSLQEVLKHMRGVDVVFIGDCAGSSNEARRRCLASGLEPHTICTGPLGTEDLSDWLAACDILLLPLDDTPYDHARFPGRLGDYLAAGRPILGAAVGDLKSVVQRGCGLLFKPGNHFDLASKMLTLLQDERSMHEKGKKARYLAENDYSWRNIAVALESIYRKTMDARS